MRRGERAHVVDLAIGGAPSVKGVAVPRGQADRAVVRVFTRVIGVAGDGVGMADEVLAAAAGNRLAVLDDPRTGRAILRLREILVPVTAGSRPDNRLLRTARQRNSDQRDAPQRPDAYGAAFLQPRHGLPYSTGHAHQLKLVVRHHRRPRIPREHDAGGRGGTPWIQFIPCIRILSEALTYLHSTLHWQRGYRRVRPRRPEKGLYRQCSESQVTGRKLLYGFLYHGAGHSPRNASCGRGCPVKTMIRANSGNFTFLTRLAGKRGNIMALKPGHHSVGQNTVGRRDSRVR